MPAPIAEFEVAPEYCSLQFACQLTSGSVLVYGDMPQGLTAEDRITINSLPVRKPYIGTMFQENGTSRLMCIFTLQSPVPLDYLRDVSIERRDQRLCWLSDPLIDLGKIEEWPEFLSGLTYAHSKKLFFLLVQFLNVYPDAITDPRFRALMLQARARLDQPDSRIHHSFWALPNVLCLDISLPREPMNEPRLLLQTTGGIVQARLDVCFLAGQADDAAQGRALALAYVPNEWRDALDLKTFVSIATSRQLFVFDNGVAIRHAPDGKLLSYLQALDPQQRYALRDQICASLIERRSLIDAILARGLIASLQHYLPAPHISVVNPAEPFGMNVDTILPIDNRQVFISGWIRDPLDLLKELSLVSDLGFYLPITTLIHRHARPYVDDYYRESAYADARGDWGFVALVPVGDAVTKKLNGIASLAGFHIQATLKSGLRFNLAPAMTYHLPEQARERLLIDIAPHTALQPGADQLVMQAIGLIQQSRVRSPELLKNISVGEAPAQAQWSIIMLGASDSSAITAQLAMLSHEKSAAASEIIFVLPQGEASAAIESKLKAWHAIYGLPLRLLVTREAYGYAAAVNLAAAQCNAPQLLLLNGAVHPATRNALADLLTRHCDTNASGVSGAITLHHDGSIIQAGYQLARGESENALSVAPNFQGYPVAFAKDRQPSIDALAPDCLLIAKEVFVAQGGLDADYPDMDSAVQAFCLKVRGQGVTLMLNTAASFYQAGVIETSIPAARRYGRMLLAQRCVQWLTAPLAQKPDAKTKRSRKG